MYQWLVTALSGPLINGALSAYKAKLDSGNTSENIAAELAAKDLLLQKREAELNAQYRNELIGHWSEPTNLFAYVTLAFYTKCVVWDTMLGLGVTPSLKGSIADWSGAIIGFFFVKKGAENITGIVARILKK